MGHRLSGEVFYGIDLGADETRTEEQHEALPQWWHDGKEWQDVLAARLGWKDEDEFQYSRIDRSVENYYDAPEFKAWQEHRRARADLIASLGVVIDLHGYEYDGKSIRITESVESCDYDATKLTGIFAPSIRLRAWNAQLEKFCSLLEFPYRPDDVGWHVCASWA